MKDYVEKHNSKLFCASFDLNCVTFRPNEKTLLSPQHPLVTGLQGGAPLSTPSMGPNFRPGPARGPGRAAKILKVERAGPGREVFETIEKFTSKLHEKLHFWTKNQLFQVKNNSFWYEIREKA